MKKLVLVISILMAALAIGAMAYGSFRFWNQPFPVTLEVDFGPAQRESVRHTVHVKRGATANDLVAQVVPVEKGAICCDPREIAGIDGVRSDPATNHWWTVSINGSKKVSPFQTPLRRGDRVRWVYQKDEQ